MFQLKTRLEHLKISQTTDSLSVPLLAGAEKSRLTTQDELTVMVTNLQPDIELESADEADDPPPEGSGDADDHVVVDADGSLCDGKSDAGNWKLRAQFG
jgi:protein involved in polysaccharide export with SLBB domain